MVAEPQDLHDRPWLTPPHLLQITSVIPGLPGEVKDALSLLLDVSPISEVSFFASSESGWWGASVVIGSAPGISALLGSLDVIADALGFNIGSSFKPRVSIAGPLSGNGLPIKIGIDYDDKTEWLYMCGGNSDCPGSFSCQLGMVRGAGTDPAIQGCQCQMT